jgi:chromosomal replication initiation ATPase DnaA
MTSSPEQYRLPLPQDWPALGREAFLTGAGNGAAVAWIDRWPDWPTPALVVTGPAGSGKSHLAAIWSARADAGLIDGQSLTEAAVPMLLESGRALVVEAAAAAPEPALLHLYNGLAECGRPLLLTAREPPARWGIGLADLRSRLLALPVAELGPPDDALIRAVLSKRFADRQLTVTDEVIDYLALRIERSFAEIGRVVAALDTASLAMHRSITLPLAQQVLKDIGPTAEEPGG